KYRLTDEQQRKLQEIRTKFKAETLPLKKELSTACLEREAYTFHSDAEAQKIKEYHKKIRGLEGKIDDLRSDAEIEVAGILTKEQRAYHGDVLSFWFKNTGWYEECSMMGRSGGWGHRRRGGYPPGPQKLMLHGSWE
ncbi:MAG: Spy/CpxP family protein refolding chaperone, partial [Thermodesulfobacteriota bacterium]